MSEGSTGTLRLKSRQNRVQHHVAFSLFLLVTCAMTWKTVTSLVALSLKDESASHILLIPLVSAFLVAMEREQIFGEVRWSFRSGVFSILALTAAFLLSFYKPLNPGSWALSGASLSLAVAIGAGFVFCYGEPAVKTGQFSLLLLLTIVPLPDPILSRVIYALQAGSTDIAYWIFQAAGQPVLRQQFVLALPNVTIQVAQECSSIRSSVALLITCLLACHLYLRRFWTKSVFVALAMLFSVVKNGVRIATLTLLSIYVDPSFLHGSPHRDGGFVFFGLALLMLWPLLRLLERSEDTRDPLPQRA